MGKANQSGFGCNLRPCCCWHQVPCNIIAILREERDQNRNTADTDDKGTKGLVSKLLDRKSEQKKASSTYKDPIESSKNTKIFCLLEKFNRHNIIVGRTSKARSVTIPSTVFTMNKTGLLMHLPETVTSQDAAIGVQENMLCSSALSR